MSESEEPRDVATADDAPDEAAEAPAEPAKKAPDESASSEDEEAPKKIAEAESNGVSADPSPREERTAPSAGTARVTNLQFFSLFVALFASGSAALVYQSTWGRMLHRVFGVGDLAIATVLASFFLGLGIGSAIGGRWGTRSSRPAVTYAILEIGVAVWAVASLFLIPRLHTVYAALAGDASFGTLTVVRLLVAFAILLPPTILMGATLPVLIAAVSRRGLHWSSSATKLYATNTFGAMFGAGATGLYLVPTFGARASIFVAAGASLVAAAVVFVAWRGHRQDADIERPERRDAKPARVSDSAKLAIALAGFAGLASLSGEVIWTRVLRMVVQGTTQAFAAMLVNYLFGIAVGSIIAERWLRRGISPRRAFAVTQLALACLTALAMFVAPQLPRIMALTQGNTELVPHHAWIVLVLSIALLLPIALVIGTSIPIAWRIAGDDPEDASQHAGRVLASNTFGGLVGSLVAGFVIIPLIGIEFTIILLMFLHAGIAAAAFRSEAVAFRDRIASLIGPPAIAVAIMVLLQPNLHVPYLLDAWSDPERAVIDGPSDEWRDPIKYIREGRNTTVTVLDRDGALRLFNDGRPESGIGDEPPGFGDELAVLGSLPTLFAARHDRAMVIGLGGAHTTTIMLGGPWERLDVVELEDAVVDAARVLYERAEFPFPLDDERAHIVVDDARAQLVLAPPNTYDAVVSQPSHPWLAGSSALYTKEFFQEVDRALTEGGVLSLWVNLFRMDVPHLRSIVATLHSVFDNVLVFIAESSSFICVASNAPLTLDSRFRERVEGDGLRPYLEPFMLDQNVDFLSVLELDADGSRRFGEGAPIIEDDRPAFEFDIAQMPHESGVSFADLDVAFAELPWLTADTLNEIPVEDRGNVMVQRIEQVRDRWRSLDRARAATELGVISQPTSRLLQGTIANYRGDLSLALTRYDASPSRAAALEADKLRHAEGLYRELVDTALARETQPTRASFIVSAALGLGDVEDVARALALAARVDDDRDADIRDVARAFVDEDCTSLLSILEAHPRFEDPNALFHATRCAFEAGDAARARDLMLHRSRVLRGIAAEEARKGRDALDQDNLGGAMRAFRRALFHNPGHGRAAAELARLLDEDGRNDAAAEVLRAASDASRGIPGASRTIEQAASELNVTL